MEKLTKEKFKELQQLPFFRGVIVSDSMVPLINIGDQIVVEVGHKELKRFDVIVILIEGRLICHYVWTFNRIVTPFLIQTRNLSSGQKDRPVGLDEYLGKVVSHKLTEWQKMKIFIRHLFRRK